jgi:hypothetical protein
VVNLQQDLEDAPITRKALKLYEKRLLKRGTSSFSPDVYLLVNSANSYVLKDFAQRPLWIRFAWGRFVIRREVTAYRRLAGYTAAPRFIAKIDDFGFLMEFVEASALPKRKQGWRLDKDFFVMAKQALEELHRRGIAHGDIRKNNILVRSDGQPCLLDFQTCTFDGPGKWRHRIFLKMALIDKLTLLKIQKRYFPASINQEEATLMEEQPAMLTVGRFLRKRVYHPISPKMVKLRLRKLSKKIR